MIKKLDSLPKILKCVLLTLLVVIGTAAGVPGTFYFKGHASNETGGMNLSGTNATIEVYSFGPGGPPQLINIYSNISGADGNFNITNVIASPDFNYKIVLKKFNSTTSTLDYIGPSLPDFPIQQIMQLSQGDSRTKFFLKAGGTINITAHNETESKAFNYVVKDTKLGYPIAQNFDNSVLNAMVYVPAGRNYSVMIYPDQSFPVSYNLNNLTTYTNNYANITFNTSNSLGRVSGHANLPDGSSNFIDLKIIAYLVEPGNMVFQGNPIPYNMGAMCDGAPWPGCGYDVYNATNGSYDIALPGAKMGANLLLFATAKNSSNSIYYGAFRNLTLGYGYAPVTAFNFSLKELLGNEDNISVMNFSQFGPPTQINVTTRKLSFRLQNASNASDSPNFAHVEVKVNYSAYNNVSTFSWVTQVSQSDSGSFKIPAISADIKKINVFTQGFAPLKISKTAAQLAVWPVTINLTSFNPGRINDSGAPPEIFIDMLKGKPECDVPYPSEGCSLSQRDNKSGFNPFKAVVGGGKLSFRMTVNNTKITVHYKNVDMMASGPPDALFDNNGTDSHNGSALEQAWRFGSMGPEIYDGVLVGIPLAGNVDASNVTVRLGKLYDDNWNVQWNKGVNNTGQLPSDYSDFNISWFTAPGMPCSNSDQNADCYVNASDRMVWLTIPHFSGFGAEVSSTVGNVTVTLSPNSSIAGSTVNMNFTVTDTMNSTSWFNITFPGGFNASGAVLNWIINGGGTPNWTSIAATSFVNVSTNDPINTYANSSVTQYINLSGVIVPSGTGAFTINVSTNNNVTVPLSYTVQFSPNINSCTNIISPGSYVLNQNINSGASSCINITSSNVVLDGAGYTIDGGGIGYYGVYVKNLTGNLTNVTVKNLKASNWYFDGIYYKNVQNGSIINNTEKSNGNGIGIDNSHNNTITNNTANSNLIGIDLRYSNNNTLTNNTAKSNTWDGISVANSNYNTLTNNTANSNGYYGISVDNSNYNTLTNNAANSNVAYEGIDLFYSNNNTLTNNTANSNGWDGISVGNSNYNTLTNNTANSNVGYDGIILYNSNNTVITNNTVNSNTDSGIYFSSSKNNVLTNNTAMNNVLWDFYSELNSINNTVTNLNISTVISFTSKDVAIRPASSPGNEPVGTSNISKYINATNKSAGSWLFLNASYTDADVAGVNESALRMWKYNGSSWSQVSGTNGVNTAQNYVYANITSFSIFAPMAAWNYGVNLANISNITGTVIANINATYTLNITNTGDVADTYNLTIDNNTNGGASTVALNISPQVSLGPGASRIFTLNVTNTSTGTFYVNVTATSRGDASKVSYVNTTTLVNASRGVSLTNTSTSERSNSTRPGINATYYLNLTNTGQVYDTFTLAVVKVNGVSNASLNISLSQGLNAGASTVFTLNVSNAAEGVFYVNVSATSVNDSSKVAYVNTTTSVTSSPPGTPTSYWGNVTINGNPYPNATITVYGANSSQVANTTGNQTGWYLVSVPWDDPATPADEGVIAGELITFKVNGIAANTSAVGIQGFSYRLDLNILDTTPLNITFVSPTPANNSYTNITYVNVSITLNKTGGAVNLSWNGTISAMNGSGTNFSRNNTGLTDGYYYYFVNASDVGGNVNTSSTRFVTIDTIAPVWAPTPVNQNVDIGTNFSYDVNATDLWTINYSVNDTTNFRINSSTGLITNKTSLSGGIYWLLITATDPAGNANSSVISVTVSDTTAPVWVPVPSNRTVELGTNFSYDVNATDLSTITYGVNDNTSFSINTSTGLITNKTALIVSVYVLNITAADTSGNTNWSIITVTVVDTTKPVFINLTNLYAEFGVNFSYQVNATDLQTITYGVNDTTNFSINTSTGLITNNTVLTLGSVYGLRINVTDASSNVNSSNITVTVRDTTPPVVVFLSPPTPDNGSTNTTGYVNFSVVLNENGTARLNWNGVNESMNGTGMSFYNNKTVKFTGNYTFKVYANDTSGNFNFTETRTITVNLMNITNISGAINGSTGNLSQDIILISPSGNVIVTIFNGTNATVNGTALGNITINSPAQINATVTGYVRFIGENLTLEPANASFIPQIQMRFNYTDAQLTAAGITDVSTLRIRLYNTTSGSYSDLAIYTINTTGKYITANASSFGTFALVGTAPTPCTTCGGGSSGSSGSSGGGGGGGGGGGPSGENYSNILIKERVDMYIFKDKVSAYFFKLTDPIVYVNITGNLNAGEITTTVEVLKDTSALVNNSAPGTVYKNVNIWAGMSGFNSPKNIKEGLIVFKILNSWMSDNNVKGKDVVMVKWDGSKWISLETKEISKNDTHTYFEAKSNLFSSPFAITTVSGTTPEVTEPPKPEVTPKETPKATATTPKGTPAVPAGLTLVMIAGAAYLIAKRKKEGDSK